MTKVWVGTINARELYALSHVGIEPVGQVYGASVRAISTLYFPATTSEVHVEMEAFQQMLADCMASMNREADALGANGVIDCEIVQNVNYEMQASGFIILSMQIMGTGVIDRSYRGMSRYFAHINSGELIALRKGGYDACGLVVGTSSFYQVAWRQIPKLGPFGFWANEEVYELTQGPYTARELAMSRMVTMARNCSGTGIVGVKVESQVIPTGSLTSGNMAALCRMRLVGTAIRSNGSYNSQVSVNVTVPVT